MTSVQLALDFTSIKDALKLARKVGQYVDWIEAGTPLIKAEGMRAVRALRRAFPKKSIVADMKTMDVGALEVRMAADAGADAVTVLGAAPVETIKAAIREGRKRGVRIIVDLIGLSKSRWKEIAKLRPDYLCVHVGIDQQRAGVDPLTMLRNIKLPVPLIVAGGMNRERIPTAVRAGVAVIIVGSAITGAQDPKKAAAEIRKALAER